MNLHEQETSHTATVLFVDDEPSILSALRRLFRPEGYRLLLAKSGRDALELLAREPADLIVCDMRMPEMSGVQFLEQAAQLAPDAGRMLLTGYADISSTIAAINQGGIQRYIAKPWDDQDMLLCVKDGLERQRLVLENRRLLALTRQQNQALQEANEGLEARVQERTAELAQVNDKLSQAYSELEHQGLLAIKVFTGLLELRGGSSVGYSERVGQTAQALALRMGFTEQEAQDCYVAGLLHEVGKIGLSDAILKKPLPELSGEQADLWRQYPLKGEAALMPLTGMQRVAALVRSHMERVDGKGFPDSLAGKALPLQAQVVGVACVHHGLMSGRLAQKGLSAQQARDFIQKAQGRQFHNQVVQAYLALPTQEAAFVEGAQLLRVADLEPGMRMAHDLLSEQGTLLLAKGFVFDARVLEKLQELVAREALNIMVWVQKPMV